MATSSPDEADPRPLAEPGDPGAGRDPGSRSAAVHELAEEFLARYRRGEQPPLTEYTDQYPDLAAEIREVFPAIAAMEQVAVADASLAGNPTGPPAPPALPPLAQLGDYRIIREVGRGGMGVVYEAEQLSLGRHVALKVLPGHGLLNPTYLERFRREAKAAARLHHTNIVPVFGTGAVDGTHFYAMQFIRGEGLDRVLEDLRRLRRPGEPAPTPGPAAALTLSLAHGLETGSAVTTPPPAAPAAEPSSTLSTVNRSGSEYYRSVARIGVQVADALAYAHKQGVLHRDIKPSNLLLDLQGAAWVTDFGLAKADGDDLTQTGDIVGTIRYMAPERFDGKSLPESDVYSLGLTLYELLTLRPAFDAPNRAKLVDQVLRESPARPRKVDPQVPRDLETVVLKCLAKDPKDRYATADELAEDLRRFLADRTIRARRATNAELAWRWCRRNPAVASLVTLVLVLLVGVSVASSVAAVRMKRLAADEQTARRDAETAAGSERWERYRANVSAAASALWVQNAPTAGRHLEAAPPAHRNWEWRYLHARLDGARAVLRGHEADVTQVDFSADGRRLASAARDGTVRLWDPDTGRESAALRGHGHWVKSVRFSPVGTLLAVASFPDDDAPLVHVWDAAAARLVRTLPATHRVGLLAWTPDGHHLAGHAGDAPGDPAGRLSVWDVRTGVKTASLEGSTDGAVLAVRPGGRHLARAVGSTCLVWDREAGREVFRTEPVGGILRALAYSPDGRRLAAGFGDPDNRVRLLDADTGRPLPTLDGHTNTVVSLAYSPDGSRLASSSMDQTVRLWDGATGDLVAVLRGHAGTVPYVTFTPDGRHLLSASPDGTVRLWDGAAGGLVAVLRGHQGPVNHVGVRPDGRTIASASADGTVRLWDTELMARNGVLTGHTKFVYDVAVRPDGRELASAAWDGTVRLWDPTTGRETGALRLPAADPIIGGVAYHPDGRRLAAVYRDGRIALWDVATRTMTREVRAPTGSWAADPRPVFNPAGTLLAVGSSAGTVHLIDPDTGERVGALACSTSPDVELSSIEGVAFSADGARLAVGCYDNTVQVWDVRARERRQVLSGHPGPVFAVAFSPDGRLLASADRAGSVRLWDTTSGQEVASLPHRGAVHAVAFSPDGTRLAAGCVDNGVHLWDVATRQEVVELRGHEQYVHALAWSPDGTRLVTGSGDTTIRVWDALSAQERAEQP